MKSVYKKKLFYILVLVCLVPQQLVSAPRPLIVGVEDTYYYPHYEVRDEQWQGFGAAVLERFAQSAGYELIYKPMPVERLFRSFVQGEVDFKYPAAQAWKPEDKSGIPIIYSDPVIDYIDGLNLLEHRVGESIENIRSIGIVRGFTPVSWSDRIAKGEIELVEGDSFVGLIRLVLRGRIDAIYANLDAVSYTLKEQQLADQMDSLVFDKSLPHDSGDYRLATLRHGEVIDDFNAWMIANAALMQTLKVEYFGHTPNRN